MNTCPLEIQVDVYVCANKGTFVSIYTMSTALSIVWSQNFNTFNHYILKPT